MRAVILGLAAVLVLSGCSGDDPEIAPESVEGEDPATSTDSGSAPATQGVQENATPPAEVENTGPKSLRFEQTFALTVTHVKAGTQRLNFDPNCVGFGKDQVWLMQNGTIHATWSSNGPFANRMTLDVRDIALMATNNGTTSPGALEFGRFQTVPNALLGLWFIVQPTDDGVVAKQPVELTIAFNYLGHPDLKTVVEPCVYAAAFEDERRSEAAE